MSFSGSLGKDLEISEFKAASQVFKLYSIYILKQISLLPSYLFIFGCSGSWLLLLGFLYLHRVGLLSLQRADFPCRWPLVAEHRLQGVEAAVAEQVAQQCWLRATGACAQ